MMSFQMKPKMKEFKGKGKRNVQRNDSEDSEARVSEAREGAKAGLSNRKIISILLLLDVDFSWQVVVSQLSMFPVKPDINIEY